MPGLGAAQMKAGLPTGPWQIHARDVMRKPSRAMAPLDMWNLALAVREEIDTGADGVVITHGTDTLEETTYALALVLDPTVPVVLTGAMRPPHTPGADGPANLQSALAAAASRELAPYGPVVVFQDEIHVARWVTKKHSARIAAFASPAAGPVGAIVEGQVHLMLGPVPGADRLGAEPAPPRHRVELVWTTAGADGFLVQVLAGKVDGLVVAGTGGGHLPPLLAEELVGLVAEGCPVVLSSRCGDAPQVLMNTYGGVGSEVHLLGAGLFSGQSLAPLKCRLRLLFGLAAGLSGAELFERTAS
jgi:L-asparaginase